MEALPNDVISNILSWLPIKFVLQGRSVCRTWLSIIDDPQFPDLHYSRAITNNFGFILLPFKNKISQAHFVNDIHSALSSSSSTSVSGENIDFLVPRSRSDLNFHVIGSINGLVCIIYTTYCGYSRMRHNSFYISNPAIRELVRLPDCHFHAHPSAHLCSGFGFDVHSGRYKVVLLFVWKEDLFQVDYNSEVLVNTVGTASWRSIGPGPYVTEGKAIAPLVNGSLHWVDPMKGIVAFNLRTENFKVVPSPDFMIMTSRRRLELGTLNGFLLMTDFSPHDQIHLWVMKDYNVKESWSIHLRIRRDFLTSNRPTTAIGKVVYSQKKQELLMMHGPGSQHCYNMESGEHKLLRVANPESPVRCDGIITAVPHTPTLFSIKSHYKMDQVQAGRKDILNHHACINRWYKLF